MNLPPDAQLQDAVEVALADLDLLARCEAPRSRERQTQMGLQRLRTLYILAVDDDDRISSARDELDELRSSIWGGTAEGKVTLDAYEGALRALEGKHAFWPHSRLRHLQAGTQVMGEAVAGSPRSVEPRYLRLVSTAFLPSLLGQSGHVQEDLQALTILLPSAVDHFPLRTYEAMIQTVLELLPEDHETRGQLLGSLEQAHRANRPLAPGCSAA